MFIRVQMVLDDDRFKLVIDLATMNEASLVHRKVLELDGDMLKSFTKLLGENLVEFENIDAIADDEIVKKALEDGGTYETQVM